MRPRVSKFFMKPFRRLRWHVSVSVSCYNFYPPFVPFCSSSGWCSTLIVLLICSSRYPQPSHILLNVHQIPPILLRRSSQSQTGISENSTFRSHGGNVEVTQMALIRKHVTLQQTGILSRWTNIAIENPHLSYKTAIKMVSIFHCYASSPECTHPKTKTYYLKISKNHSKWKGESLENKAPRNHLPHPTHHPTGRKECIFASKKFGVNKCGTETKVWFSELTSNNK